MNDDRSLPLPARVPLRPQLLRAIVCAALASSGTMLSAAPGALVSATGSERATSGAGSKVVTFATRTHVVWQDVGADGYVNRIRTLDHESGSWSEPVTLGAGKDNHARPVVAVDAEGFLHAILGGHNSPVTYRRSEERNDASAWSDPEPAGSGTYPVLVCGGNGVLYLTLRSPERWDGVDLYTKESERAPWRQRGKLVRRDPELPGYGAFHTGLAWCPRRRALHLIVDFYESRAVWEERGVHQAVAYMRSLDGGTSWERADGTPVELPARPDAMDLLARSAGRRHETMPPPVLLAQGSIVVDPDGSPHVLYVSHVEAPGTIIHATTQADGGWRQAPVDTVERWTPDHRPIGCRGALTIDGEGVLHCLLELAPLGAGWVNGQPTRALRFEPGEKRLVWLVSRDRGESFTLTPALPPKTVVNEANVERPSGSNQVRSTPFPPFVYFDGTSRYPEPGELLQNNVWFVGGRGADGAREGPRAPATAR